MHNEWTLKIFSGIIVLALALSCLVIPAGSAVAATSEDSVINFNVIDEDSDPVVGASFQLMSVHSATPIDSGTTGAGGVGEASAAPGYYELRVSADGYYTASKMVEYDGLINVYTDIVMDSIVADATLQINVTNAGAGFEYTVLDDGSHAGVVVAQDDVTGNTTTVDLPSGDYVLLVGADGKVTASVDVSVSGATVETVDLENGVTVAGYVIMESSSIPTGITAYLVSKDTGLATSARVIEGDISGNRISFDTAASGEDYWLFVDADDALMSVTNVTAPDGSMDTIILSPQGMQSDTFTMTFDGWDSFLYERNVLRQFDDSFAGMSYADLPMRMQIDLLYGDGDGTANATEVAACLDYVDTFGPAVVLTEGVLEINDTYYKVDGDLVTEDYDSIIGAVYSSADITSSPTADFVAVGSIEEGGTYYLGDLWSSMSTSAEFVAEYYNLVLVDGYELTSNSSAYGDVSGYTTVNVAYESVFTTDHVSMEYQQSEMPDAYGSIVEGNNTFTVTNDTGVLYYIVGNGTEVEFNSADSYDPNQNPLTFTWDFDDGTDAVTTMDTSVTHEFTQPISDGYNVTLTVTDVAGLANETSLIVKVDGVVPDPAISSDKNITSGTMVVDQNEVVTFNSTASLDKIWNETGYDGVIKTVTWDFGDDTTITKVYGEDMNVTHSWAEAGTYDVVLNATDGGGNYMTVDVGVTVNDITPPEAKFTILNSTWAQTNTAQENQTMWFDASASTDDHTSTENLTFVWSFGDGAEADGVNVSHAFASINTFTVYLNVTDEAGNWDNISKTVTITSSPRPDLRITEMTFSSNFEEGAAGKIYVNVTNVGNAPTTDEITITFYTINDDGTSSKIGTKVVSDSIEEDGYRVIEWEHAFSPSGNYTVKAEASTPGEINTGDNTFTSYVNVDEAGWKALALYGGIFAIIIVVIVLVYYRKKIPGIDRRKK